MYYNFIYKEKLSGYFFIYLLFLGYFYSKIKYYNLPYSKSTQIKHIRIKQVLLIGLGICQLHSLLMRKNSENGIFWVGH